MSELFLKIINMSIAASWLVLAVLVLRVVLKKAPKWVNVLLWGMVAVRLVCPISFESVLSLIPSAETVPMNIEMDTTPAIDSGVAAINSIVNPIIRGSNTPEIGASVNPLQITVAVFAYIWVLGVVALLVYTAISYWCLCKKVDTAVLYRDNIYQSETIASPFVLGIVKPRIYLPFQIEAQNLGHVVAHERAHIRRKDHWWKPLGFLLLTIYWFNPLMWLAYVLLCRDIELACDEKVIKQLGNEARADYTQALLFCSVNRRMIAACPLAFGEVGVKERVKSVMNYKKPGFWVMVLAVIACIIVAVCFLTNPKDDALHAPEPFCHSYRVEEILYDAPQYSFTYTVETAPRYQFTSDYAMFVSEDVLDDVVTTEWVQQQGAFKEVKLTNRNFDDYFKPVDNVSGWRISNDTWAKLRNSIHRAWRIDVENNENGLFYYLILTKQDEVYLTYGYDVDGDYEAEEGSLIRWLFKLTRIDILSVNAISEGCNAYIEPQYYPDGFDWNYDDLALGEMYSSGKLVFTVDWDAEELVISEDYYEETSPDSALIHKGNYTLVRNAEGKFELDVVHKNPGKEEMAVYFVQGETGTYVMKIHFVAVENKVTKWFDYTENPSDMDWNSEITTQIPEFPGITFRYTPEQIVANGASYSLEDRGNYDYYLRWNEEDGLLYVDKKGYGSDELV